MSTRKNLRLEPIAKEELIVGKFYTVLSRKSNKKDIEGIFVGLENDVPKFSGIGLWLAPESDYAFFPISVSRKQLKLFGINVATLNKSYPARNAAFYAVPNFKRHRKTRKQVKRSRSRFA